MSGLGDRFDAIAASVGTLCVGIDPSPSSLSLLGLPDTAAGARSLAHEVISAATGLVGIVKPQVGYFERFGAEGYRVLEEIICEARDAGLAVIADAKRGDIGSTMVGYADAWLADGPLSSDALTVTSYQGLEALEPAFDRAEESGATVFVLAATSNPDAKEIQSARVEKRTLPQVIAAYAQTRTGSRHTVGIVVGATRPLDASGLRDTDLDGLLVLAPGFGAQGASLTDLRSLFGNASRHVIPSVSRSVLALGLGHIGDAIKVHLRELAA